MTDRPAADRVEEALSEYPEGAVVRIEDAGPIERAYSEAMHEDCDGAPPGHPLADHSPWSGSDLEGVEPWPSFVARLARHGLSITLDAVRSTAPATGPGLDAGEGPYKLPAYDALHDWQDRATAYSEALIAVGHHPTGKHESPGQYDSDSALACTAPGCLAALRAATEARSTGGVDEVGELREALEGELAGTAEWADHYTVEIPITLARRLRAALATTQPEHRDAGEERGDG